MKNVKERRNVPRYKLPLNVWTEEGFSGRETLIDMSSSGCALKSNIKLEKEEHILIHFETITAPRGEKTHFCLHGCIVWSKKPMFQRFKYGIRFQQSSSPFFKEQQNEASYIIDELKKSGYAKKV